MEKKRNARYLLGAHCCQFKASLRARDCAVKSAATANQRGKSSLVCRFDIAMVRRGGVLAGRENYGPCAAPSREARGGGPASEHAMRVFCVLLGLSTPYFPGPLSQRCSPSRPSAAASFPAALFSWFSPPFLFPAGGGGGDDLKAADADVEVEVDCNL